MKLLNTHPPREGKKEKRKKKTLSLERQVQLPMPSIKEAGLVNGAHGGLGWNLGNTSPELDATRENSKGFVLSCFIVVYVYVQMNWFPIEGFEWK